MEKVTKINLACGNDYREGYLNIDNQSMFQGKIDRKANIFTLKWKENSLDEILLLHFAMYIDSLEMPLLLRKWNSWLKTGGKLIIETGDLKKIAGTIYQSTEPETINGTNGVMQLFGWANMRGHKWAWCYETLEPLLRQAGFTSISREDGGTHNRPERDITITAIK